MEGQLGKDGILWDGSHTRAVAESGHEGTAETKRYGLTATPFHVLCCLDEGNGEE